MTPEAPNLGKAASTPWMERRTIAEAACADLINSPTNQKSANLVREFSCDPKWEIRKVVAEALASFPEGIFREILPALAGDKNAFVRSTALRASEIRMPTANLAASAPGKIQQAFDKFVANHGHAAAEDALKFAHKITERHLRTAVHDIKNILASFTLDLDDFKSLSRLQRRKLERYKQGCGYLQNLAAMMATYSEDPKLSCKPELLRDIIIEAASSARTQIENAGRSTDGVRCVLSVHDEVTVNVSRFHMVMVFTNLIKNGIEAHAASPTEMNPGEVLVTAQIQSEDVVITIADKGRGISLSDLAQLREFIPGASPKRNSRAGIGSGTGYGLPICRRYVDAHGGFLNIQSAEGAGTSVSICLPLNRNQA